MGLKVIPENILRRIPRGERVPLGKAGLTFPEACAKKDARQERELQKDMANLLEQRQLFYWRSRMDKRPTIRKGLPDFLVVLPGCKAVAIEAKVEGGELSPDQKEVFDDYWKKTGNVVHIVWNLEQFRTLLDQLAA